MGVEGLEGGVKLVTVVVFLFQAHGIDYVTSSVEDDLVKNKLLSQEPLLSRSYSFPHLTLIESRNSL